MLLDTPICDYGWNAKDFTLPDADGKHYSLAQLSGENGLLIAFICNHCPYVQAIIERLVEDAHTLKSSGIGVAAIMSNDYQQVPSDGPEYMRRFAEHYQIPFPYLVDQTQEVARAYDAVCTPDFFGFNKDLELQYRGRLDNVGIGHGCQGRNAELVDAMLQIAQTGKGPEKQIASMGCSIKWR